MVYVDPGVLCFGDFPSCSFVHSPIPSIIHSLPHSFCSFEDKASAGHPTPSPPMNPSPFHHVS